MATYVLKFSNVLLKDGTQPWTLTADTEEELHTMAAQVSADKDKFSSETSVPFYILSRTKAKLAIRLGAFSGNEAMVRMRAIRGMLDAGIQLNFKGESNGSETE